MSKPIQFLFFITLSLATMLGSYTLASASGTVADLSTATELSGRQASQLHNLPDGPYLGPQGTLGNGGEQVIFYPTPVKDYINIKFPYRGQHTVRIYNIVGKEVASKSVLDENIVRIGMTDLPGGMYFIEFEQFGRKVTKTFSKY